jgi:hypothetical protein
MAFSVALGIVFLDGAPGNEPEALATDSFDAARGSDPAWGTVKGQLVWSGKDIPAPKAISVKRDEEHCLSKGPLVSDELVVNKKNGGVRWAFVWLSPETGSQPLAVHPSLQEIKDKEVAIDQPCCMFVPHALALRQGQELLAKNSAPIAHNVHWQGHPLKNPGGNNIVPPGKSLTISNLKADKYPVKISCDIHGWMSAWVRVFDHPYFAVTDADGNFEIKMAPAGDFRLMLWHEAVGNIPEGGKGIAVAIRGNHVTDVGPIQMPPPDNK